MTLKFYIYILSILISSLISPQLEKSMNKKINNILINNTKKVDSLNQKSYDLWWSNPTKGLKYAQEAIKISKYIHYKKGLATAYNYAGSQYYRLGDYKRAAENQIRGLKIHTEIGNLDGVSESYDYLATVYRDLKEYDKAIKTFKKAISIDITRNDQLELAISYSNLSTVYFNTKDYNQGIIYAKKAIKLFKKEDYKEGLTRSLNHLGMMYSEIKDYNKAINIFKESLSIKRSNKRLFNTLTSYSSLGKVYFNKGQLNLAESSLMKALKLYDGSHTPTIQRIYNQLYKLYLNKKDYKKALKYHELKSKVQDSLSQEFNKQQIIYAKTKYDTEIKERENLTLKTQNNIKEREITEQEKLTNYLVIGIFSILMLLSLFISKYHFKKRSHKTLVKKNTHIIKQEQKLRKSISELNKINYSKDKLISLISHDLKNPFNLIIGFSELLGENFKTLSDKEKLEYILKITNASNSAYQLLEDILTWSKTQQKGLTVETKPNNLRVLTKTSLLSLILIAEKKKIKLINNIDKKLWVLADSFTLSTVINNLVSNAIKFTPQEGEILLFADSSISHVNIYIKDNGVGMSEEKLKKLFLINGNTSTVGTNNEKGTGLGLLICDEFTKLNKGIIKAESKIGIGTCFTISLPIFIDSI